jgi:hypothetical protein
MALSGCTIVSSNAVAEREKMRFIIDRSIPCY